MIDSIAHTTDFSDAGQTAFVHALRLAMEFKCRLDLLHVRAESDDAGWDRFPHVRETLERWGKLPANSGIPDIAGLLGVDVRKIDIRDGDATDGLARYLEQHRPGLLAMSTHGRSGISRWLAGSVSLETAAKTRVPTLLIGHAAQAFVDAGSGELHLRSVLMPVDHDPAPQAPLNQLGALLDGLRPALDIMHVGADAPGLIDRSGEAAAVRLAEGDVVETILAEAANADLIVMPTAGRHGFLDALRGSTTERVLSRAARPVLALHAH